MCKKLLFVIAFLYSCNLFSNQIVLDVDYASFKYDEKKSIYEFYYSFPDSVIKYNPDKNKFLSEVMFSLKFRQYDSLIKKIEWIVEYSKDSIHQKGNNLFGQKTILLPPGYYNLELMAKDLHDSLNHAHSKFTIYVQDYSSDRVQLSDIELAQIIEPATGQAKPLNESHKKNGLYVVPNPTCEIIGTRPSIKLYTEIYNAASVSPKGLLLEYRIIDAYKNEVLVYPKKKNSETNGLVETIEIPIEALPSGVYDVHITLKTTNENVDSSVVTKKIYVLNPDIPPQAQVNFIENKEYESSEFATMDQEQVNLDFERSSYLVTQYEKDLYKKCTTTDAKKHFMFAFWKKRNMDTSSPINLARQEYLRLAAYADKYFSQGKRAGWRTDRGKITLKYGEPAHRDIIPMEGNYRAYEKWLYPEYLGGAYFYFVDISGNGNYILVNSTVPGEVQNDYWYEQYVIPQNSNANSNMINRQK